jgi:hypothetical protein
VRRARGRLLAGLVAGLGLALAAAAHAAEPAPADTTFDGYVRGLSDSTDAWFGVTAAPLDTAGLDSALAAGLARGPRARGTARGGPRRVSFAWSPAPGFNRVDGAQIGLGLGLSGPWPGEFEGRVQWTSGGRDWVGEGGWHGERSWRALGSARGTLTLSAGRWTEPFDRDAYDPVFATLAAVIWGGDHHDYLRRDGWRASARLEAEHAWAGLDWRDHAESPRHASTDWNVFGAGLALPDNRAAVPGRARELGFLGGVDVPGSRFRVQLAHRTSDPRLGSDLRYRRTTLATGGDVSIGRHLALVPQGTWGRLRGDVLPQDELFLGGSPDLLTLERNERSGAGRVFVRADLVWVDGLASPLHLPLPAWMPLHASAFVAAAALWGTDPATSLARATRRDLPARGDWLPEAGLTLAWRTGVPEPMSALRLEYAWPLGPGTRGAGFAVSYHAPLHVLRLR